MPDERLKILTVLPYLPFPLESGGRTRSFNLIKHLSKKDDVWLVSLIRNQEEEHGVEALRPFCKDVRVFLRNPPFSARTVLKQVGSRRPYYDTVYGSPSANEYLKELTEGTQFDVIHLECAYVGQYMDSLPAGRRFLLDPNIEYWVLERYQRVSRNPLLRSLLWLEARRMRRSEQRAWREADFCGTVSDVDRNEILRVVPDKNVWVIPNGVDFPAAEEKEAPTAPQQILFTGNFRYFANVDAALYFCREIFPKIAKSIPGADFLIVGKGAASKLKSLAGIPGVRILDWVPDLNDYLRSSAVFVCPLRVGSGTKLKVLEAMAVRKAIVTSSVGAEGLDVKNGEHLLIADGAAQFATSVCRLLLDAQLRTQLGEAARVLVKSQYTWERIAERLHNAYRSMVESKDPVVVDIGRIAGVAASPKASD